mmetsp:Transcript_34676/g.59756  ORF Transcript_34676/g.59756 Transcript_34676/m.59756 type:complete len:281 (+) Transcript_34676:213-1055(+)
MPHCFEELLDRGVEPRRTTNSYVGAATGVQDGLHHCRVDVATHLAAVAVLASRHRLSGLAGAKLRAGRVAEEVDNPQARGILGHQCIELFTQQNVLFGAVLKQQREASAVHHLRLATAAAFQHAANDLQARGQTRATSDQTHVLRSQESIGCVFEAAHWSSDFHRLPRLQGMQIRTQLSVLVALHQQVKVARLIRAGGWRVCTHHLVCGGVLLVVISVSIMVAYSCAHSDVAANRQSQGLSMGDFKADKFCVVRYFGDLENFEFTKCGSTEHTLVVSSSG